MKGERHIFFFAAILLIMVSCREYTLSDDPSLRLTFSTDTLRFDTIFTNQGSATLQLMVYNRNASAIAIDRIWLDSTHIFEVNIDGEQDLSRIKQMTINGGDSAFVFVRTRMNKTGVNSAVLTEDQLHFHLKSGATQAVCLEAYGQDVTRIRTKKVLNGYHFTSTLPYLIFDTLRIDGDVTIDAGSTLYMHSGACICITGDVTAVGSLDQPIIIRGDRLDRLFDSVPYAYAGGSWNGIYLQAEKPQQYDLAYVDILSGNIGLYCWSSCTGSLPNLRMDGCRIHNHTLYGLVLIHVDALVTNTEISNCASYCVYCEGGKQDFIHTTIASYYGNTNIRLQPNDNYKPEAAAVYIDNLSKTAPQTITSFYNSIITGYQKEQLVLATPIEPYYPGKFVGNYIGQDTTKVFVNNYYKYKEYVYYDFRLDSLSPARGIGDSIVALPYPLDREGFSRAGIKPDAGCYQYRP